MEVSTSKDSFETVANDSSLWDQVPVKETRFSKEVLVGTATSEYQYSGQVNCPNNQWAEWEKRLPAEKQSGQAWDLWNRPAECVQILKRLHFTSFRFSVEWSKIEPEPGVYDRVALQHYVDFCKMLKREGIEPMVTLHHFTHPIWFDKLGAFEKEENVAHFVNFSKVVYTAMKEDVRLWCTINEPTIVAFQGYFTGAFPPNRWSPTVGAEVMKNLLKAHCDTYRALKAIDRAPQIGIVHQALKFVPYRRWNPAVVILTQALTEITHAAAMRFFATGEFHLLGASLNEREIDQLNDFIGVNCYVRPLLHNFYGSTHYPHEQMTLMPFREDPAAIYEALMEMHQKTNKPLYVTEVGISTHDEKQLERFMERALYAIYRAEQDGVDLKGIYWWSLMNNWEWDRTWDHNFGICHDDGTPREGARSVLENLTQAVRKC
ncbi:MAG: glycoside hydrolase family 1 protein [Chlamydiales bacterium]|nr:glycoside hydrolase family 1 protein [Chlamydiales bacterium]